MLEWTAARRLLFDALAAAPKASPERRRLTESVGCTLLEAARAGRPSPPFDKAMMDGFALRTGDFPAAPLPIAGEQAAGPGTPDSLPPGHAVRIMTGAPVPPEADCVIPVEQTTVTPSPAPPSPNSETVVFSGPAPRSEQNILRCGSIVEAGAALVAAGTQIAPQHLAVLAEFGHAEITVARRPQVAILATGNELVAHDAVPGPGQIRNSNGPMLAAQVAAAGGDPLVLGIAPDDRAGLAKCVAEGLAADVLVLSGGVSAGDYDYVADILTEAGVRTLFHKIAIKPGKPLLAGQQPDGRPVFGLPGNPVSSFVCFHLFVRPSLAVLSGRAFDTALPTAPLAGDHTQRGNRVTFWPARVPADRSAVQPLPWKGSADLVGLAEATALAVFPAGDRTWTAGQRVEYVPL